MPHRTRSRDDESVGSLQDASVASSRFSSGGSVGSVRSFDVEAAGYFIDNEEIQNFAAEVMPYRVEDRSRKYCFKCDAKFAPPYTSRHHCRCCGEIYCKSCCCHRCVLLL